MWFSAASAHKQILFVHMLRIWFGLFVFVSRPPRIWFDLICLNSARIWFDLICIRPFYLYLYVTLAPLLYHAHCRCPRLEHRSKSGARMYLYTVSRCGAPALMVNPELKGGNLGSWMATKGASLNAADYVSLIETWTSEAGFGWLYCTFNRIRSQKFRFRSGT